MTGNDRRKGNELVKSSGKSRHWDEGKKSHLLKEFKRLYPNPQSELCFRNDYELLISVILSAQCTDKKVNEVTPDLFRAYPNFACLAKASLKEVERIIRQVNYFKTKSKNIIATAKLIHTDFSDCVPTERKHLESLPGVGRKTANVILSEKGIEPAFPVDTHVYRVSRRLKLATRRDREAVEEQVKAKFQPSDWRNLHHWLIFHGRRVCKAQNPVCETCTLKELCPSVRPSVPKG